MRLSIFQQPRQPYYSNLLDQVNHVINAKLAHDAAALVLYRPYGTVSQSGIFTISASSFASGKPVVIHHVGYTHP